MEEVFKTYINIVSINIIFERVRNTVVDYCL